MNSQVTEEAEFSLAIRGGCLRYAKHISGDDAMREALADPKSIVAVFSCHRAVELHIMSIIEDVLVEADVLAFIRRSTNEMGMKNGARIRYFTCSPNDEKLRGWRFTHYRTF